MAIQIRRGTNTEWESNNSNIVVGEPAIATDAERFFVGTASGDYAEFANLDVIAPAYDTTTSYVVGDVVNRQGKLYSCNTPCSGAFNASYWDEKSLAEILKDLENEIDYAQYEIGYASGELITIDNGASEIPVKDLTLDIEAVQSGSGDPSPTNVRPISGWDEVNVCVAGKNLVESIKTAFVSPSTDYAEYTTDISGTVLVFKCVARQAYTISGVNGNRLIYAIYDSMPTSSERSTFFENLSSGITFPKTITPQKTGVCVVVVANTQIDTSTAQIELGSTATAYEPYNGQTYTIDLDGTRYGGTLDVTTGVLTVTHGYAELQNFSDWVKSTSYQGGFYRGRSLNGIAKMSTPFICSHAKTANTLSEYVVGTCYCDTAINIRIMDASTTVTEWQQYLADQKTAGTPVTICYELATPQVVQLTPTQVRTVLGTNNLWNQMNSNNELAYRISNALN